MTILDDKRLAYLAHLQETGRGDSFDKEIVQILVELERKIDNNFKLLKQMADYP